MTLERRLLGVVATLVIVGCSAPRAGGRRDESHGSAEEGECLVEGLIRTAGGDAAAETAVLLVRPLSPPTTKPLVVAHDGTFQASWPCPGIMRVMAFGPRGRGQADVVVSDPVVGVALGLGGGKLMQVTYGPDSPRSSQGGEAILHGHELE